MKSGFRKRWVAAALMPLAVLAARCASSPPTEPADAATGAALVGEWGIQIKLMEHPVDGTLRFTQEGRALLGSFTDDVGNQSELQKLRVGDGRISWEMDAREGTIKAKGTLEGTIMSGKMTLKRSGGEAATGFGIGPGGMPTAGRRVGEPDSYSWTAIKRAPGESSPPPPPPQ